MRQVVVRVACLGLALLVVWAASAVRASPTIAADSPRVQPDEGRFTSQGAAVVVHALPTGLVGIRGRHHHAALPDTTPFPLRMVSILLDRTHAAPMPILTYLVRHPDGDFIIDAGATPDLLTPARWAHDPVGLRVNQALLDLDVRPEESLPARLQALGIDATTLGGIVLTHQHLDHVGAVAELPGVPVITTRAELTEGARAGAVSGLGVSAAPLRLLEDELAAQPSEGPFGPGLPLTQDGALTVFKTPGHTPGSTMARLTVDQGVIWFVGDVTFTEDGLGAAALSGIHADLAAARALQAALLSEGRRAATLILPAHDAEAPVRLARFGE
jgi:glyoxylase-like metal-dependent hydrolase (beta-lactamase superfamily II)